MSSFFNPRQGDQDLSPRLAGAKDDETTMSFDDAPAQGQTQSSAALLRCVKRFKGFRALLFGEPGSIIVDGDADGRSSPEFRLPACDCDADRVRAGGQGVVQEIAKDHFEP